MNEKVGNFITSKTVLLAVLAFLVLLPYSLNEWAEYQHTQLRLEAERAYLSNEPNYGIVYLLHGAH